MPGVVDNPFVIAQDQLVPSTAPGKVRVRYPRGSLTVLSIDTNGQSYLGKPDDDGVYQQFVVLSNGNLLSLADRVDSVPSIVLGAGLVGL